MERQIFKFKRGDEDIYGDPLVLRDRLYDVAQGEFWNLRRKVSAMFDDNGNITEDFAVVKEGIAARGHLVAIACEVFGLTPFDEKTGAGTLAADALAVTDAFLQFLNQKKTSTEPAQTTSPSTESTSQPQTATTTATMSA